MQLLIFGLLLLHAAGVPVLVPWPTAFSVHFAASVFNTSNPQITVAGSPAVMYYDYQQRAQRLSFAAGCPVDVSNGSCDFIFNASGGYLITHSDGQCCRQAVVGPPRPDWITNLDFVDTAMSYGQKVLHFRGGTPKHNYYILPNTQQSAALLVVEDIYEVWQFVEDFRVGPQDPSVFLLPGNCSNTCSNALLSPRFLSQ